MTRTASQDSSARCGITRLETSFKAPMLFQINSAATEQNAIILLHSEDNVAVARVPLSAGQSIEAQSAVLTVVNAIPAGHKVALERIQAGQPVRRYGETIGIASAEIEPGEHVHEHHLAFHPFEHGFT